MKEYCYYCGREVTGGTYTYINTVGPICPECVGEIERDRVQGEQQQYREVTDIQICKLPYQDHPFVHGARDGKDVWLKTDGLWTEVDGHAAAQVPLREGLEIVDRAMFAELVEAIQAVDKAFNSCRWDGYMSSDRLSHAGWKAIADTEKRLRALRSILECLV